MISHRRNAHIRLENVIDPLPEIHFPLQTFDPVITWADMQARSSQIPSHTSKAKSVNPAQVREWSFPDEKQVEACIYPYIDVAGHFAGHLIKQNINV